MLSKDNMWWIISNINHITMIVEECNKFDKGEGVNIASLHVWKIS